MTRHARWFGPPLADRHFPPGISLGTRHSVFFGDQRFPAAPLAASGGGYPLFFPPFAFSQHGIGCARTFSAYSPFGSVLRDHGLLVSSRSSAASEDRLPMPSMLP